MLRMQEMAFPCFKFQKFSGEYAPDPPIHAWYVGHTRGLQPFLSPSNILSHRKVPFQKMRPPTGKSIKKALDLHSRSLSFLCWFCNHNGDMSVPLIEMNITGTLPPTGNLKPT